jgi:hypothetical protein
MNQDGAPKTNSQTPSDEDRRAMRELLKGLQAKAHFRYPVDEPSEVYKAVDAAVEEIFGPDSPNSARSRWVRRLRRHGLIR